MRNQTTLNESALPYVERPQQRLQSVGASALTLQELLALLLQSNHGLEIGAQLITRFSSLAGIQRATVAELTSIPGIGPRKATQLTLAFELGRRFFASAEDNIRPQITSPQSAANVVMADMMHLEQEELWVLCLNTRNVVMHIEKLYKGSQNSSVVRVGELYKVAVRRNAAAIIVVHNHPSGNPDPSPEDISVTREIVSAGKLLSISCLDHLIIGRNRYVSLKERQLMD